MTKNKSTSDKKATTGRLRIGKLNLNKETVTDLTNSEQKQIKGGVINVSPEQSAATGCCGQSPLSQATGCCFRRR